MAMTTGGSADSDAANTYGTPGDATRMSRMANIAGTAAEHTTEGKALDGGFIAGSSFKETAPSKQASKVPGTPGFPGE